jgi:hypothetical protein
MGGVYKCTPTKLKMNRAEEILATVQGGSPEKPAKIRAGLNFFGRMKYPPQGGREGLMSVKPRLLQRSDLKQTSSSAWLTLKGTTRSLRGDLATKGTCSSSLAYRGSAFAESPTRHRTISHIKLSPKNVKPKASAGTERDAAHPVHGGCAEAFCILHMQESLSCHRVPSNVETVVSFLDGTSRLSPFPPSAV